MIIIDNFYKINILQFEAKEDILVFKIKYDMKQYSDFKNYCSDNFLHKKRHFHLFNFIFIFVIYF